MKKIFLSAAILMGATYAHSQYVYNYLKAANSYYKKSDYASAAKYYEMYLGIGGKSKTGTYDPYAGNAQNKTKTKTAGGDTHQQAVYGAAESYRQLNNYTKAENFYQEASGYSAEQYPLAKYQYAVTLRSLGKYADAQKAFTEFLSSYKANDSYTVAAKREIENLQFIQQELHKKDLSLYTVKKQDNINTPGANYAPVLTGANTMIFTSTRVDSSAKSPAYINHLYEATVNGNTTINKIDIPQPSDVHQGVAAVAPDGKTIYLTRWTMTKEGKKTASLYQATKTEKGWSEPTALEGSINAAGSNNQQPFVTADGKYLLFASDRTGGIGGFDIWFAPIANGKVGQPKNMGSVINTPADEQAPYYHAASQTLVFASNGRVGMGGFDLYQAKGGVGNGWATVKNLGYPVNSEKDDIYFASKGTSKNMLSDVVFSSDRSSECCLDMFSLQKQMPAKKVAGKVVACDGSTPLAGAKVQVMAGDKVIANLSTGADGSYSFTMDDYQPVKVSASTDGYQSNTLGIAPPQDEEMEMMNAPALCLVKAAPAVGDVVVVDHMYYEINKSIILDESKPAMNALVKMMKDNPAMTIEIEGHTDNTGTKAVNQKLSTERAKHVVDYLVSQGIDAKRLKYKGYADTMPVDTNETPEGRAKNRRTEYKVLNN
ncbi:OmpA family protein [Pinibacter soli]|uniref:OmpA family protein n=1 Tax=Pinibacter soli TaxID=3044211 RepID=A0ABT6RBM3_9BACT|nr:OmpA family protein [Pinibacter soli]MDI3319791.1 OmpA family protein [Pinibacter soli]